MKKILVIEDDIDIQENIVDLLETNGFEVVYAANGFEGLKLAENDLPDLILCDIMMPGIDGFNVKEKLQEKKKTSLIPFVFLTAKAEVNDIRKGMILGADDYIVKPFDSLQLIESINARLKKHQEIMTSSKVNNSSTFPQVVNEKKDKILINANNEDLLLEIANIICIKSDGNYTNIFTTDNKKLSVRKLIGEWEKSLPPQDFLRIHQSTIINTNFIQKIEKLAKRTHILRLKYYDKPLTISTRYSPQVRARFQF